ncbi:MAG: hypothetical protein IJ335_00095 [Lachnospiraceae bacterium]|nr:hypothetical protein [Lachnospiraceae bacterium]
MLSGLFVKILNMSLTASLVILVVLIARFVLRRSPKVFSYCLWVVVLFRLLCPVSFSTSFSLLGALGQVQVQQGSMLYLSEELLRESRSYGNGVVEEVLTGMPEAFPEQQLQTAPDILGKNVEQHFSDVALLPKALRLAAVIWIVGILVLLIYDGVSLARLRRQLQTAVHDKENIYTCSLPTAFVMGMVRPKIYLPDSLSGREREYILFHEQVHIKRGNHVIKTLAALALCIHWFNPLVWLAFSLSSKDMEMSCDEAVLRKIGRDVKKEYSASLLNLATGRKVFTGMPLAFGEGDTGSRIKNVLKYKKPAVIVVCLALIGCVVLAVALTGNPLYGETDNAVEHAEDSHQSLQEEQAQSSREHTFRLDIRELSKENRTINQYVYYQDWQSTHGEDPIVISKDCIFEVNHRMDKVVYEEVSFEEFADLLQKGWSNLCYATVRKDTLELTRIQVWDGHAYQGIYPQAHSNDAAFWVYDDLVAQYGDTVLADYFTLEETFHADIADGDGVETIEVYRGVINEYEEVGLLVYKNAGGELLGTDGAYSYHHPTTYYVNEASDGTYLLQIHIENRDTHGEYRFHVYRLSGEGDIQNIAGSRFSWDSATIYDEEAFKEWLDLLNSYYEGSRFLMEVREDEIGVNEDAVSDRYTFDKLSDFTKYDTITLY